MKTHTQNFLAFLLFLLAVTAYSQAAEPEHVSPEQKVLDRFLGTWQTKYKTPKTEWTPVEKEGSAELTYSRILGGRFVQEQGTHEDKTIGLVMYGYDLKRMRYRMWWFSSTGQTAEATGEWNDDTKTLNWTYALQEGQDVSMTASHRFLNDNSFEWEVVAKDRHGKNLFRTSGKATRRPTAKK